ncbi:MAG: hypothetical protein ABS63_11245 [Microbacterium sp. SCN 70-27]|uniref:hypothetical protein n=1 Tax=unclassified Microbacterium TaxID=2609290 RepID=UPI000869E1F7|nr:MULTISPECIES: hypothetical protein [unclassified Microbacterium]MBN9224510.1 hypothetical protein [Microbacterium sp.]ODT26565.1 MAG: hypothetical protein ABS63_11245 [Microbacterium sp. SCN 70-27]
MSEPRPGLSPRIAVAFASAGFVALVIAGFGMLSLLTDTEVLPVTGLGQAPGIVGVVLATLAFVGVTARAATRGHPRYTAVVPTVAATFLAYLAGVVLGAVFSGGDPARAISAAGAFATSWFAVVLASAALICGWAAIALVRTRASRPRWPWENDEP